MRRLASDPAGRTIVVGGHSRGVGKTALVVAIVRALAPRPVATVKVSAHRHGAGRVTIEEDAVSDPATSTGRCLAAGAARAFLCRCPDGRLHEATVLVGLLAAAGYDVVVESNRMAPHLAADLTLFVVSAHTTDWKASSSLCLSRADALVLAPGTPAPPPGIERPDRRVRQPVLRFDAAWRIRGLTRWIDLVSARVRTSPVSTAAVSPPGLFAPPPARCRARSASRSASGDTARTRATRPRTRSCATTRTS